MWDLSCPDWPDRIRRGDSLIPHLPDLDEEEGERAVGVFGLMRLADIIGKPRLSEAAGEWFQQLVSVVFGSIDPLTGERMIREFFLLVPKKNSKTSYAAGMMLTALLLNKRDRAEFLLIGPTKQSADIALDQVIGIIKSDPEGALQDALHIVEHEKKIIHRKTEAELLIKAFAPDVLTGVKPVGVMIDELHEIAKSPKASKIIVQLRGGILPNAEGFLVFTTTQSDEPPVGAFEAELRRARAIRDGKTTGAMLPMLYEFPPDIVADKAKWSDPANWHMVTPNAGRSITVDRLVEEYKSAQERGPSDAQTWASQHLNIEIGVAQRSDRWAGADHWEKCANKALTLDDLLLRSEVVTTGTDGGGLDDLLGFAVLGRERVTRKWLLWTKAWVHENVLELRKSEASTFEGFQKDGDLVIVKDMGTAYADVAALTKKIDKTGLLATAGFDAMGVSGILDIMDDEKIAEGDKQREAVRQGFGLNGKIKDLEVHLADGRVEHTGSRLMNYCVGNAKVEVKGNAILVTKQASGTGKIDPLMAAFTAVAPMSMNPKAKGRSFWDVDTDEE